MIFSLLKTFSTTCLKTFVRKFKFQRALRYSRLAPRRRDVSTGNSASGSGLGRDISGRSCTTAGVIFKHFQPRHTPTSFAFPLRKSAFTSARRRPRVCAAQDDDLLHARTHAGASPSLRRRRCVTDIGRRAPRDDGGRCGLGAGVRYPGPVGGKMRRSKADVERYIASVQGSAPSPREVSGPGPWPPGGPTAAPCPR